MCALTAVQLARFSGLMTEFMSAILVRHTVFICITAAVGMSVCSIVGFTLLICCCIKQTFIFSFYQLLQIIMAELPFAVFNTIIRAESHLCLSSHYYSRCQNILCQVLECDLCSQLNAQPQSHQTHPCLQSCFVDKTILLQ